MASVALGTVRRGLAHTLTAELGHSLAELVLGAETFTASRSVAPVPEPVTTLPKPEPAARTQ